MISSVPCFATPARSWVSCILTGLLLLSLSSTSVWAQTPDFGWESVGPNNWGGLTRDMFVDTDGTVYAGSSGGGLWRSTNRGVSWAPVAGYNSVRDEPVSGFTRSMVVSAIAKDPSDGTWYIGTGDLLLGAFGQLNQSTDIFNLYGTGTSVRFPGALGFAGTGVYTSTDGGQTFSNLNATWNPGANTDFSINNAFISNQRVIANNGRVLIATLRGVWYSDDKLQTVSQATTFTTALEDLKDVPVFDLEFGAGDTVYCTTSNYLYISADRGSNFTVRIGRDSLPRFAGTTVGLTYRYELAVAPGNPSTVYLAEVSGGGTLNGVWRAKGAKSEQSENWTRISPASSGTSNFSFAPLVDQRAGRGARGKGFIAMAVDPSNEDHLFLGGQRLYDYTPQTGWVSNTSPLEFFPGYRQYVAPDMGVIKFDPQDPNRFYVGTGLHIMRTDNKGIDFQKAVGNYNVFNANSVTATLTARLYAMSPFTGVVSNLTRNSNNFELVGGFGGGLLRSSIRGEDELFASREGGPVLAGLPFDRLFGVPEDGAAIDEEYAPGTASNWFDPTNFPYVPFAVDEVIESLTIKSGNDSLFNQTYVYIPGRNGSVWVANYEFRDLVNPPPYIVKISRLNPNSIGNVTAMAVSGDTSHTLFVGTLNGRLYRNRHANDPSVIRWEEITPFNSSTSCSQFPLTACTDCPRRTISRIVVNPHNPNQVLITYLNPMDPFGTDVINVAMTDNALDTEVCWFDASGNLPKMPVYTAIFNPDTTAPFILLGTERGIYASSDFADNARSIPQNWEDRSEDGGIGRRPVMDFYFRQYQAVIVELDQGVELRMVDTRSNRLYAATWGGGIFSTANEVVIVGQNEDMRTAATPVAVKLYPNPSSAQLQAPVTLALEMPAAGQIQTRLLSIDGREIKHYGTAQVPAGNVHLKLSQLPVSPGLYLVEINITTENGQQQRLTQKLLVQE